MEQEQRDSVVRSYLGKHPFLEIEEEVDGKYVTVNVETGQTWLLTPVSLNSIKVEVYDDQEGSDPQEWWIQKVGKGR